MITKLTIQKIADDGARAYVTATIFVPMQFAVSDASRLAGLPLKGFLVEPFPGTYVFELRRLDDAAKLRVGITVELD
jgi:hypothetical protein